MTFMPTEDLASALAGYGKKANPYDTRRKYGYGLMQQGMDTSPIVSPWQGAARLAQALVGGLAINNADTEEKAAEKKRSDALAQAMAEPDPQKRIGLLTSYDPDIGARGAVQLAVEQAKLQQQQGQLKGIGERYGLPGVATGVPSSLSPNATAISGVETGGQPNGGYGAVGPVANAQGHRAYGKFQVLEPNIGPWTQKWVGRAMTPQEFLMNPEAQNKVFEGQFGEYVTKYGSPQAASRAWFAGEGGMNNPNARDVNGMTPVRYEQQFNQNLPPEAQGAPPMQTPPRGPGLQIDMPGPRPQGGAAPPIAGGQGGADGMPPQPSPQGVSGPAVVAPQQPPAPPQKVSVYNAPREFLAPYVQKLMQGGFGLVPAEAEQRMLAAAQADLDRGYENDKALYEQKYGDYKFQREQGAQDQQNTVQNEAKMREQFDQLQPVKDYRKANTVFRSAVEASKVNSAAADLNMVYAFATLMDPGSVVRDSETGMVTATQSASDRIKSMVAMVSGGQRLSPEARAALINEMGSRHDAYKLAYDDLGKTFRGIAERSRLNPENVVVPHPEVEWKRERSGKPAGGLQNGSGTLSTPAGNVTIQRVP